MNVAIARTTLIRAPFPFRHPFLPRHPSPLTSYLLPLTSCLLLCFSALAAPFSADLSHEEVTMRLEASLERVDPARDLTLTITVETPSYLEVKLPDLRERFSGFSTAEDFFMPPAAANDRTLQTHRWRLTPEPAADRYRLAPFAVEVLDKRHNPPKSSYFATKPVTFPAPPPRPPVTGDPEVTPEPVWIPPTAKSVSLWIIAVLAAAALLAAAVFGLTRLSRRVREYRMSPLERAMAEMQRLLNRNLPAKGLFKEFYIELTMVVRRYIERQHGIRAPEQTTQEFLEAASRQPAFTQEVVTQLKTFLESADLVKFAGQEATVAMTEDATSKARAYINSDAPHQN